MKGKAEELEFIRSLKASDKDGETSFVAQPYLVGMYIAITLPNKGFIQQSLSHPVYKKWSEGTVKKMTKNGMKVETTTAKYIDFHTKEDIENYILKQ